LLLWLALRFLFVCWILIGHGACLGQLLAAVFLPRCRVIALLALALALARFAFAVTLLFFFKFKQLNL
jgi:hypothetical protein